MKYFRNTVYPTTSAILQMIAEGQIVPVETTLESVLAESQDLTVIDPGHNVETQKTTFEGGVLDVAAMTYTLAVVERKWFARIGDRDTVQEISENPDEFRTWVEVPAALLKYVKPGWLYAAASGFSPTSLPDFLVDTRVGALQKIAERHAEIITLLTDNATAAERDTWIVKENAARDVIAGGTGGGVIVPVEGETALQLALKIVAKSDGFRALVGIADNIKRTSEKAVEALSLKTLDDLMLLEKALDDASTNASAAAAAFSH